MSLDSPATRAHPESTEAEILAELRSAGYGTPYDDQTAEYRIVEPQGIGHGRPTVVGLLVIRDRKIAYAEFDRTVYPWWGRSTHSREYVESLARLRADITEGRRK
jgi:hypothetical protein